MTTGRLGIIYLQRDRFQFYAPLHTTLLEFRFVPEIVRDLDVVNKQLFMDLIKLFLVTNKIPLGSLTIIVANNASFIKDFVVPQVTPAPVQKIDPAQDTALLGQVQDFLDHVPFEQVKSSRITMPNGYKVVAVNQELYGSLVDVLETQGFVVESVFPAVLLGNDISNAAGITPAWVNMVEEKVQILKNQSLLLQITPLTAEEETVAEMEEVQLPEVQDKKQQAKSDKKRLMMLVGVFGFLILLLIVVIVITREPAPQRQPAAIAPPATVVTQATAGVSIAAVSQQPTIPTTLKSLTVQIVSDANSAQTATLLRNQLSAYGFGSVSVINQQNLAASQTVITFSSTVGADARNTIIGEVKLRTTNYSVQEKQDTPVSVSIVLGK